MARTLEVCALILMAATLAALTSGCASRSTERSASRFIASEDNIAQRIDRGDWMVTQGASVFKVMAQAQANRPPQHVGFLEKREYRQRRGGPEFTLYSVTTRDREEQVGHIDQLGRAYRYEPRRNGSFNKVLLPANTLEFNVQAILGSGQRVTFDQTNERRLAFEALDADGDGLLQPAETSSFGARIAGADSNRDGVVDFAEFNAVDVL
jgi:hypothetical protein